jgi:hypothetical protein
MDDKTNAWLKIVADLANVKADKKEYCYSATEHKHIYATKGPEVKYRTYGYENNARILLYKGPDLQKAIAIREEYDKDREAKREREKEHKNRILTEQKESKKEAQRNPWTTPLPSVRWY